MAGLLAEVVVLNAAAADGSSVVDGVLDADDDDGLSVVSVAAAGLGAAAVVHATGTGAVSVVVMAAVNVCVHEEVHVNVHNSLVPGGSHCSVCMWLLVVVLVVLVMLPVLCVLHWYGCLRRSMVAATATATSWVAPTVPDTLRLVMVLEGHYKGHRLLAIPPPVS